VGQAAFEGGNAEEVINGDAQFIQNGQENLDKPFNSTYISDETFYNVPKGAATGIPPTPTAFPGPKNHATYVRTMTVFTGDKDTAEYKSYNVIYASDKKGEKYVPIAISSDGGRTYLGADDDPKFPFNSTAVDFTAIKNSKDQVNGYDDLLASLNKSDSNFAKGVKNQVNNHSFQDGSGEDGERVLLSDTFKNQDSSLQNRLFNTNKAVESEPIPESYDNPFAPGGRDPFESKPFGVSQISYPEDLDLATQDALEIRIMDREPVRFSGGKQIRDSNDQIQRATLNEQGKEKTLTTIYLPIQSNIRDQNTVDYDGNTMNFLQATAIAGIKKLFESDADKAAGKGSTIGGGFDRLRENLAADQASVRNLIGSATASAALGGFSNQTINTLSSRFEGQILNPNLELLFKGPVLRDFPIVFLMSPRNDTEAVRIKTIINMLKRSMAVKKGKEGSFFLGSPDFFKLRYLHKNNNHDSLHKFKDCVLKDMRVDYTPQGTYATYRDGSMHSYQMTLTFGEIDPVFAEDYDTANEFAQPGEDLGPGGIAEIGF
jgi:hypothetical protein